jgi:serine/threonine protein kinase
VDAPESKRLLWLAGSISEGSRIDWKSAEQQPDDAHNTEIVRELEVLDQIASFHRSTEPSGTPTGGKDSQDSKAGAVPQNWGHFAIIEQIGSGTFGTVYRATDTKLQLEVALKLLWPANAESPIDPSRALKEARLLARVRHHNVVAVYGTDQLDGRVGIWMEFVKGRTLASLLSTNGPLSAKEAGLIGLDLCRALAAVHKAGLVHGDVKAHNVMREEGGRTVLMDFGTGKDVRAESEFNPLRAGSDFAGTPLYLAPEVFKGKPRTKSTDIYSLGVLLFHLVSDAYPVDGATRAEVEQAHRNHSRRHLRDVRPDLPEEFVHIVERALAPEPRDRYQSAGAFEAALASFVGASAETQGEPRSKRLLLTAAIIATAMVSGSAYWVLHKSELERTARNYPSELSGRGASSEPLQGAATDQQPYRIDTVMYRATAGREVRLQSGARVAPGDQLFASVRVSVPAYVYIVNEDEQGESYLLFPLPGQSVTNPLPASIVNRLPGTQGGREVFWQVTSAGGREHFLVFASPAKLPVLEQLFAALPRPEAGRPIQSAPLSREVVGALRGVGGLAPVPGQKLSESSLTAQFPTPLRDSEEVARGLWVRQLTLDNPLR